jgi:hypothetical protein
MERLNPVEGDDEVVRNLVDYIEGELRIIEQGLTVT